MQINKTGFSYSNSALEHTDAVFWSKNIKSESSFEKFKFDWQTFIFFNIVTDYLKNTLN